MLILITKQWTVFYVLLNSSKKKTCFIKIFFFLFRVENSHIVSTFIKLLWWGSKVWLYENYALKLFVMDDKELKYFLTFFSFKLFLNKMLNFDYFWMFLFWVTLGCSTFFSLIKFNFDSDFVRQFKNRSFF
jgi:hypothetical protein